MKVGVIAESFNDFIENLRSNFIELTDQSSKIVGVVTISWIVTLRCSML